MSELETGPEDGGNSLTDQQRTIYDRHLEEGKIRFSTIEGKMRMELQHTMLSALGIYFPPIDLDDGLMLSEGTGGSKPIRPELLTWAREKTGWQPK